MLLFVELEITISLLPKCFQLSILMDFFHGNGALIIIKVNWKISSALPTFALFPSLLDSIYFVNQEIYLFEKFLQNNH